MIIDITEPMVCISSFFALDMHWDYVAKHGPQREAYMAYVSDYVDAYAKANTGLRI